MPNEQGPKSPEVPDSEEFLNQGEDEREVVNDRLGFSYQESIIAIPEARREEYGISQITRRKITKMPSGLELTTLLKLNRERLMARDKSSKQGYKYSFSDNESSRALSSKMDDPRLAETIHEITEGLFPGWHTWSHVMGADAGLGVMDTALPRFKLERLYFQTIFPEEMYQRNKSGRVSGISDGWPLKSLFFDRIGGKLVPREGQDYGRHDLGVFDLSVMQGHNAPWDPQEGPLFAFGSRNKSFNSYVTSISNHPEVKEMLRLKNWNTDTEVPITELDPNDPHGAVTHYLKKYPFLPKEKVYGLVADDEDIPANKHNERNRAKMNTTMSLSSLEYLVNGVATEPPAYHPRIPIVQHPDIKPLRWCQADVGIVTTDKNINVLLFE